MQFFARLKIVINSFLESGAQFRHGLAVKPDDVIYTRNMADKAALFITIFDSGSIAFVGHGIIQGTGVL
jgi:hypothetical protein